MIKVKGTGTWVTANLRVGFVGVEFFENVGCVFPEGPEDLLDIACGAILYNFGVESICVFWEDG